jgi:hypothetical protein
MRQRLVKLVFGEERAAGYHRLLSNKLRCPEAPNSLEELRYESCKVQPGSFGYDNGAVICIQLVDLGLQCRRSVPDLIESTGNDPRSIRGFKTHWENA